MSGSLRVATARERGAQGVLLQLGIVAIALLGNLAVRWYTVDQTETALANAHALLDLQERLHLDWEHAIQDALDQPWLGEFFSWFYVWGYLPVVLGALVVLYLRSMERYLILRDALLASGVAGLLVYALYPVAPPRLTALGYHDTIAASVVEGAARPVGIANEIAAVPSFHLGWLIIVAVVVYRATSSAPVKVLCVAHPVLMGVAVLATGNHWLLDLPAGALIAVLGLAVADRLALRRTSALALAEPAR